MNKQYAAIGIIITTLVLSGLLRAEPVSAKDECGTKKMQQEIGKIGRQVVTNEVDAKRSTAIS
jgi:hypothetical protein